MLVGLRFTWVDINVYDGDVCKEESEVLQRIIHLLLNPCPSDTNPNYSQSQSQFKPHFIGVADGVHGSCVSRCSE